jgi:hypothetical protein
VPLPSHREALVATPAVQLAAAHVVPLGKSSQALAPLQFPLCPQELAGCAAHSLSGSRPEPTGPQVPSFPEPFLAPVHATHVPVQVVLQQTPSTQLPDWQLGPVVHAAPRASFATQEPDAQ